MAPAFLAAVSSAGAVLLYRRLVTVTNPLSGLTVSFVITVLVSLVILALIPSGRRALQDVSKSLLMLRTNRGIANAAAKG